MRPDSTALHAEQFPPPKKLVRSLLLLDETSEIPQEHCDKSSWTLRSTQNEKLLLVPQINSRGGPIPLHWLQSHLEFPTKHDK